MKEHAKGEAQPPWGVTSTISSLLRSRVQLPAPVLAFLPQKWKKLSSRYHGGITRIWKGKNLETNGEWKQTG